MTEPSGADGPVRVGVRVKPGSSRSGVGGSHGDDLIVAVTARAVDGAATEATLAAVADALGVRRRQVSLRSGFTSRSKVVDVDVEGSERDRVLTVLEVLRGP